MTIADTSTILDLFCGCGGFSLGARLAGLKSVLSVDLDPILSSAYKLNFPDTKLINFDLAKVSGAELLAEAKVASVFGIIGGPPCQGFSTMGRRDESDPRNQLIGHFISQVLEIRPKFFIMENVPGLLHGNMREKLDIQLKAVSEFYTIVGPVVVKASELGAATSRQRVLIVGYLPESFEPIFASEITSLRADKSVTVRDAIFDIPPPLTEAGEDFGWNKYGTTSSLSLYAAQARMPPPIGLGQEIARQKLKAGYVSGLQNTVHSDVVAERYRIVVPGKGDKISKSPKLAWDGLCPTLRAGTGSEKGSYQAVRPLHPELGRVITVREAARLQGFPDWFLFHPTKWHSFRMIGNSVSPHLSYEILKFIKSKARRHISITAQS